LLNSRLIIRLHRAAAFSTGDRSPN
jgi:hypothetical protein